MRKFESTFLTIAEIRSIFRGNKVTTHVKKTIGDSVKNNRTLTVNQTVRYLTKHGNIKLARTFNVVANILEKEILRSRNKRTDAIDINELVTTYRRVVMNGRKYRREIGTVLSKVG